MEPRGTTAARLSSCQARTPTRSTPGRSSAAPRRIRRVVTACGPAGSGGLDTDRHVYYDGWRCVEERLVTTTGESWSEALAAQYLWGGQYLDELVAFEVDLSDGQGGDPDGDVDDADDGSYVVWHDALYSAVAVLSAKEGHLGELLERYEYDPYGRATIFGNPSAAAGGGAGGDAACTLPLAHSAVALPFTFTGQRLDPETGLMYYKRRYYDPATGRFTTRDPLLSLVAVNLYRHARNAPSLRVDPLGLVDMPGSDEIVNPLMERATSSFFDQLRPQPGPARAGEGAAFQETAPTVDAPWWKGTRLDAFTVDILWDVLERDSEDVDSMRRECVEKLGQCWDLVKDSVRFHVTLCKAIAEGDAYANGPDLREVRVTWYDGKGERVGASVTSFEVVHAWFWIEGYWTWRCKCDCEGGEGVEEQTFTRAVSEGTNHKVASQAQFEQAKKELEETRPEGTTPGKYDHIGGGGPIREALEGMIVDERAAPPNKCGG